MGISIRITNLGIEITEDNGQKKELLQPAKNVPQENPRRNYVYAHLDEKGKIFYVGKGIGQRAWSRDRHSLWERYVKNHLDGKYYVQILQDNLSAEDAEELEADWIAQCGDTLVNWENMGRSTDFQALDQFHELRDANRSLIQQAKIVEKLDIERAAAMYLRAIEASSNYAFIHHEKGLVGQLLDEEASEVGYRGEIEAINRLTMCLVKLGRADEANQHAENYFRVYRLDLQLVVSERIKKRIENALSHQK